MAHDPVGEDGGQVGGKTNYGGIGTKARKFEGKGSRDEAGPHGTHAKEGYDPSMAKGFDVVSGNPPEIPVKTTYKGARNPKPARHKKLASD
jgi:hypothetical protein